MLPATTSHSASGNNNNDYAMMATPAPQLLPAHRHSNLSLYSEEAYDDGGAMDANSMLMDTDEDISDQLPYYLQ